MHRLRLRWVIPFALAAIGMCVIAPSASAATPNLLNTCKAAGTGDITPGAEMAHYPAWPASQSYLRVACIFNHSTGGSGDFVSSTFTIHDFSNAVYHNGAARSIVGTGGPATITTTDCRGMATWVNRGITGTNVVARTFVTSITGGCAPGGTLNLSTALTGAPAGSYLVENSNTRAVTDATITNLGGAIITSPTANFTAADNGLSVSATFIDDSACPVPGRIVWPASTGPSPTTADIDACAVVSGVSPHAAQLVTIGATQDGAGATTVGISTTRTFNDGTFGGGGTTITSTVARFHVSDIGLKVAGTGITQPCFITARSNTVATLSSACNDNTAGTKTVTIGDPTFTAPASTDTVQNQGVQLPLNPGFVPGSRPCAEDSSAGFGIEGSWRNPGNFVTGPFSTQPANTKAVGQIVFATAVISYAAFVIEVPAAPAGTDPVITGYHFNIVYPNVPTGLALCASTATSPGLGLSIGINATTLSQSAIPTGQGRPSTAQLRSLRASTTGSNSAVSITDDVNGAGVNWQPLVNPSFTRSCSIPSGTPDVNFKCGDG